MAAILTVIPKVADPRKTSSLAWVDLKEYLEATRDHE